VLGRQVEVPCQAPVGASSGEDAWRLCVRPEAWAPRALNGSAEGLAGSVRMREFLGPQMAYVVEVAPGILVKAVAQRAHGMPAHDIGDKVELSVPPSAMLLPAAT
jgi:hypothetical protein